MTGNHAYHRRQYREQLVQGYSELIREKMDEGKRAYFLNFMFNQLPGSSQTRMEIMSHEVERVHSILTHHVVRRPNADNWAHLRPIFVGSHDLPVFKWNHGKLGRHDIANDGLHFNAIALMPPSSHPVWPDWFQFRLAGPQSRLKVPLDVHFKERSRFYLNDRLVRIHTTLIMEGTMADYTLKAFKHGRVSADSVLILN